MSASAGFPNRRARCARCNEPREHGAPIAHPTRALYRCGRCGYINVAGAQAQALPMPESLAIAGAERLRQRVLGTRDAEGAPLFEEIVAALANAARTLIENAPAYALGNVGRAFWLAESELAKHGGKPQGNDLARTSYAKASALLFVLSARHGVPDLDAPEREPATPAEHAFQRTFWPVATDACASGSMLHRVLRGDAGVRIRDGAFFVELTELGLDTDEFLFNRRDDRTSESYQNEQIRSLRRALALRRGIDVKRLLEALFDATGKRHTGVVTVPKDGLSPPARTTFDAFELTAERVGAFHDAWFLDLAPRRLTPAADSLVTSSLVTRNWSAYYPLITAVRRAQAIYMMGAHGVEIALDNLMQSKNRLLQELTEAIPNDVPATAREELRDIRVALNRHAEARAHALLSNDGWRATTGENWNLAAAKEEIDVLAARLRPAYIDVVVGEVKDFDFTLHRLSGPAGLSDRIRRAEAQLGRKHAQVVQSISAVLQRLGLAPGGLPVHVHALLITSDAPPAGMLSAVDGVDFAGLGRFSELLDNDRELATRLFGRATRTLT